MKKISTVIEENKDLIVKRWEEFPDPKDVVFYEVAFSKENAYPVSGNLKHFPKNPRIVSPSEMMKLLEDL